MRNAVSVRQFDVELLQVANPLVGFGVVEAERRLRLPR
jgi:hypothetical protein